MTLSLVETYVTMLAWLEMYKLPYLASFVGSKESFLYNRSLQCNAPLGVMLWGGGGGGGGEGGSQNLTNIVWRCPLSIIVTLSSAMHSTLHQYANLSMILML